IRHSLKCNATCLQDRCACPKLRAWLVTAGRREINNRRLLTHKDGMQSLICDQKTAAPPTVLAVNCFQHPQPSKKYKSKTVRPNPSESVSPPIRKTDGHRRRSIIHK